MERGIVVSGTPASLTGAVDVKEVERFPYHDHWLLIQLSRMGPWRPFQRCPRALLLQTGGRAFWTINEDRENGLGYGIERFGGW